MDFIGSCSIIPKRIKKKNSATNYQPHEKKKGEWMEGKDVWQSEEWKLESIP